MKAVGVLASFFLLTVQASAQGPTPDELVRGLGDPDYAAREDASQKLRKLGAEARPALLLGQQCDDPEIRRRSAKLLGLASKTDLQRQLDRFILDEGALAQPLPGWKKFKDFAGSTLASRADFARFYEAEKDFLATIENTPEVRQLETILAERLQRHTRNDAVPSRPTDLLAVAWLAYNLPKIPQDRLHFFQEICYQPQHAFTLHNEPMVRKLIVAVFQRQPLSVSDGSLDIAVQLASTLGLKELIDPRLKTELRNAIVAETKEFPYKNVSRLNQLANLAQTLKAQDVQQEHLRPAAQKAAEWFASIPFVAQQFNEVYWLVMRLEMTETRNHVLLPALVNHLVACAEFEGGETHFFTAFNSMQMFVIDDKLRDALRPAALKVLKRFGSQVEQVHQFHQPLQVARLLRMTDTVHAELKPAFKKIVEKMLAQPNQWSQLSNLANLAQQLGSKEVVDDLLVPHIRKELVEWSAKPRQLSELHQIFQVARTLNKQAEFEGLFKPISQKMLAAYLKDWRTNTGQIYVALELAAQWNLKADGLALSLDVVLDKKREPWLVFHSLQFLAKHGNNEHFNQLESLLAEKQVMTSLGVNNRVYNIQVRDFALQLMVQARGEKLADYGFKAGFFQYAVLDDHDREAAFRRWHENAPKK